MPDPDGAGQTSVGVTAFKSRSLELIEQVASGKLERVILTKRGRPVAAIVPLDDERADLWGALAEVMAPVAAVDLTEPTGERWAAEDE